MPRYEFMCERWRKGFEVTLNFGERVTAKVKCLKCGSRKVTPQITVFTAKTSWKS